MAGEDACLGGQRQEALSDRVEDGGEVTERAARRPGAAAEECVAAEEHAELGHVEADPAG